MVWGTGIAEAFRKEKLFRKEYFKQSLLMCVCVCVPRVPLAPSSDWAAWGCWGGQRAGGAGAWLWAVALAVDEPLLPTLQLLGARALAAGVTFSRFITTCSVTASAPTKI